MVCGKRPECERTLCIAAYDVIDYIDAAFYKLIYPVPSLRSDITIVILKERLFFKLSQLIPYYKF